MDTCIQFSCTVHSIRGLIAIHKYVVASLKVHVMKRKNLYSSIDIPVPESIDPVFAKTSPKRSFSVIRNERFGLVFVKTGSIISGTVHIRQPHRSDSEI